MRVKRFNGRVWNVRADNEDGRTVWVFVIADRPEQALTSFRAEFPGHNVLDVHTAVASSVIVPD